MTDHAIKDSTGRLIGVVTRPARGIFWGHSIHRDEHGRAKRRFKTRREASAWIERLDDELREETA